MGVQRWLVRAGVVAVLVSGLGCSGGSGSLATVSGVVKINDAPADGAKVTLHSTVEVGGKKPGPFSAITDSSGKYVIASDGKLPGIPPGMYKVTITKLELKGNVASEVDQGQIDASGQGRNALPRDYENLANSKLTVTLETGKNENKNFDLKGKASTSGPMGTP